MSEKKEAQSDQDQDQEQNQDQDQDQDENQDQEGYKNNALEWAVAILGGLIVLGTIGFLTYKIFAGAGAPPDLRVTLGTPDMKGSVVLVPVEVENQGGSVAEDAIIEVCTEDHICAELTFTFIPHNAKRSGKVGFKLPLSEPLEARVMSYHEP